MVEKIAKWGYCFENSFDPEDPRLRRSDWHQWLKKQKWYGEDLDLVDSYPDVVNNILQPQEWRKEFFLQILNSQVTPSSGYQQMAELMARKRVSTVLTTNFDTILRDVCNANKALHHLNVIQTTSDHTKLSTSPPYPQIIYLTRFCRTLHGQK